jgi:hypothetical protein
MPIGHGAVGFLQAMGVFVAFDRTKATASSTLH